MLFSSNMILYQLSLNTSASNNFSIAYLIFLSYLRFLGFYCTLVKIMHPCQSLFEDILWQCLLSSYSGLHNNRRSTVIDFYLILTSKPLLPRFFPRHDYLILCKPEYISKFTYVTLVLVCQFWQLFRYLWLWNAGISQILFFLCQSWLWSKETTMKS